MSMTENSRNTDSTTGGKDNDEDDNEDDNEDSEDNDEDGASENGEDNVNQSLETVFRHPLQQAAATNNSDTDSEVSDNDKEPQQEVISLWPNPQNPRHSGPSNVQTGR